MDTTGVSEKAVYDALSGVFCKGGKNADLKQLDKIQELIKQHAKNKGLAALLQSYNVNFVCNVAQTLLEDGIFSDKKKKKKRFANKLVSNPAPCLCLQPTSPALSKTEVESVTMNTDSGQMSAQNKMLEHEPVISATEQQPPEPFTARIHLPYGVQHRLLVEIQHVLEEACFEFAKRTNPAILEKNGWDCSEAAELNLFVKELGSHSLGQPVTSATNDTILIADLVSSISKIRHAAVHRERLSTSGVDRAFEDSEHLLTFLGDDKRVQRIKDLRHDIGHLLGELDQKEREVDSILESKRNKINEQRQELQRLEEIALQDAET
ncbi:hypothetical protein CDD83_1180 [Cordyceps sp. RAO-2017]|nr:hypothetical protein CDD83_1180 [Cordyceps sp. RAO-2017]